MTSIRIGERAYILLEVLAAAALLALTALSLSAALITATAVNEAGRAVTRGRLLAQSHLEQAAAGEAPALLRDGEYWSMLTVIPCAEGVLWQAEVLGPSLHKPLKVVGGP